MFYFYDPLMSVIPHPVTPPAITRVVKAPPLPVVMLPKGWQRAKTGRGNALEEGQVGMGKEEALHSPATPSPKPVGIVAACPELYGITSMPVSPASEPATPAPESPAAAPQAAPVPVAAALPTWSVVSWKNLAPRSIAGTRKEAVALVENDLSMAGIHHLDIQVYDAIHVIVALQR